MSAQITKTSHFGKFIYNLSKTPSIHTIVEIGTFTGEGSTKCVIDGLLDRHDIDYKFITIELDLEMHKTAMSNLLKYTTKNPRIELLYGRVINVEDLFWFDHKTIFDPINKKQIEINHAKLWYERDISNLKIAPCILNKIPENIDLLILDGGEYTTYPEYQILKNRTRIFALDDTLVLKCKKIREELISENFEILYDDQIHRNGSSIFSRRI